MFQNILFNKNITIGVGGGIAAYKSVELIRLLTKHGANVRIIMTKNATKFVGLTTFETLSYKNIHLNLFNERSNEKIPHISLKKKTDAIILAPATANIIAKIANGIADDFISTFMLTVTCHVMICPSMNSDMYKQSTTQSNLKKLKKSGFFIMPVEKGKLACGIEGPGKLPSPTKILNKLINILTPKDMKSKRILITAGPTREFIDPVRFISNPSSGKMGYAISHAAENRGAIVTLVSGPVHINAPTNANTINVQTANEMANSVLKNFKNNDIIIKTAAVLDYKAKHYSLQKIKKNDKDIQIKFKKTKDILMEISKIKNKKQIVVGFAAETENIILNAKKKLKNKKLDMIIANRIGKKDSGFISNTNKVMLIFPTGITEKINLMTKEKLADIILDRIIQIYLSKIEKQI